MAPDRTPPLTRPDGSPLRVLVADDNAVSGAIMGRFTERAGHVCVVVTNGRQALEACVQSLTKAAEALGEGASSLDQEPFDVVLLDLQMPDLNGIEAAKAIRAHERSLREGARWRVAEKFAVRLGK